MKTQSGAFEVVAEAIADGIVIAGSDSRIVWCNRGAASMFGWSPEDAVGRPLTDLMPARYRDAHLSGMARLLAGGPPRLIGHGAVEIEALGGDGKEIPVELTLSRLTSDDGELRFVAVIRDVSERRRSERERDAQLAVARALASASTTARAASEVIQALTAAMDWELGAVWLLDDEGTALTCAHLWPHDDPGLEPFRLATRGLTFRRGVGLPGRVWEQRRPVWLRDLAGDDNFPRLEAAAKAGLHGAVGMPIMAGGTFVGVLEFFSSSLSSSSEGSHAILASTGDQFVQFFRRKQAEEELATARSELDAQRFARRQAAEINDHILHWLVQITQALDSGDERAAQRATHEALRHASRIITDLQALPQPRTR